MRLRLLYISHAVDKHSTLSVSNSFGPYDDANNTSHILSFILKAAPINIVYKQRISCLMKHTDKPLESYVQLSSSPSAL